MNIVLDTAELYSIDLEYNMDELLGADSLALEIMKRSYRQIPLWMNIRQELGRIRTSQSAGTIALIQHY